MQNNQKTATKLAKRAPRAYVNLAKQFNVSRSEIESAADAIFKQGAFFAAIQSDVSKNALLAVCHLLVCGDVPEEDEKE